MMTSGSIYVHVPFCRHKCPYCHFFVHPNRDHDIYMQALKREWAARQEPMQIESVYFGGGTPYLLGPSHIEEILSWIDPPESAEITLEANPEDITPGGLKAFAHAGINRLSIGVQSLDDALLKSIGRNHSAQKAIDSVTSSPIANISIDLMFDLPGQTVGQVERTVRQARNLPITHLSLYNLVLEPPSLFYSKRHTIQQPPEELSLEMLDCAVSLLEEAGFARYEISAFAKPGYQSHHNVGYWTGRPFIGLGPSAFSYWGGQRLRNIEHFKRYTAALEAGNSPIDYIDNLTPEERQRELLAVHLRLSEGVPIERWPKDLHHLEDKGFVKRQGNRMALSSTGKLFYDTVASEII